MRLYIFLSMFFVGWVFAQGKPVLYFYQADPVTNMSKADVMIIEHITTNVIKLTKQYKVLTRATIGDYLRERGVTNRVADVFPSLAIANAIRWGLSEVVEVSFAQAATARTFTIVLRVWNVVDRRYTREEKIVAESGRDIFDALDAMSLALAQTLTGKQLGFGTLKVSTTLSNAMITIDGIEYETSFLTMENVLAGLTHTVVIGQMYNGKFFPLYTNTFEIREKFVYDLRYHHEAWVDVIDLRANTNRFSRFEYFSRLQEEEKDTLRMGWVSRLGMGNIVWTGAYFSWKNALMDFLLGWTPQFFSESYNVYFHTFGFQSLLRFCLFERDESLWNVGMSVGFAEYLGIGSSVNVYNGGWPLLTTDLTFSLRWDFSWMPSFFRWLKIEISVGTMVTKQGLPLMLGLALRY